MIVTLMIGGMVLVSIGVLGEYLARIIRGIESQPAYIVRNQVANPRETDRFQR
jgi:dolichol-phosphate mannosyltransferase/undecaprenyl-phosphate 4-deoxy-4-formamido-L-arabinose transferase